MGMSTKSIPFFTDDIKILPHTATLAKHVGRPVTIRAFSQGNTVRLEQVIETGEYILTRADGYFIHGPEYCETVVV